MEEPFAFLEPGPLSDGVIALYLRERQPADPARGRVPQYVFDVRLADSGAVAGVIRLRMGDGDTVLRYAGQVGYAVAPEHRGRGLAARACCLVAGVARLHGMDGLWVTCEPSNAASRRTCENVGATLVETVDLPENSALYRRGERRACRYWWPLS